MICTTLALLIYIVGILALIELTGWKHYMARGADYLQLQTAAALIILGILYILFCNLNTGWEYLMASFIVFLALRAIYRIWPYAPWNPQTVPQATPGTGEEIGILSVNLLVENDQHHGASQLILESRADIVICVEVDSTWYKALEPIIDLYPYHHKEVREDPFGMLILSKWPFIKENTFRIFNDTPTFRMDLDHPVGKIHVWGLHPMPPTPYDHPTSTPKDEELQEVSAIIKKMNQPTIVAGDLNDVAWSRATRSFLEVSGLQDPRVGRGLFNTFPTYAPWLGFPLDQIFVSHHFQLVEFKKLQNIGSDHYPIYGKFLLKTKNQ